MLRLRTNGGLTGMPVVAPGVVGREVTRLLDELLPERGVQFGRNWLPAMEVQETATEYRVVLEVPGLDMSQVEITVERDHLTIAGEKRREEAEGVEYHVAERRYGQFVRSFSLPGNVNADAISARYEHGLLVVTLPKVEEAKPRRIMIDGAPASAPAGEEGKAG